MQPCSDKDLLIELMSIFDLTFNSLQVLTKLVSQSEYICLAGPQIEKKHLSVFMKLEIFSDSIDSKWTSLELMQVNITAHHLLLMRALFVQHEEIEQGPNTSRLMLVKGGPTQRQSTGRSAIFCIWVGPCNLWHVAQLWMDWPTYLLLPTSQNPAARMVPYVRRCPWCLVCAC